MRSIRAPAHLMPGTFFRDGGKRRGALIWMLLGLHITALGCASTSPGPTDPTDPTEPSRPGMAGARLGVSGSRAPREMVPTIVRSIQETHEVIQKETREATQSATFESSRVTGLSAARFVQKRDYPDRSPGFAEYWVMTTTEGNVGYWVFFTGHNSLDASVSTFPDTTTASDRNGFLARFDVQEGRSSARTWRPDGRQWILAKSYVGDGHAKFEYVTASETDESGATYLLVETLETDTPAGDYAERMNRGIQKICPGTQNETLSQSPDELLIEWHAPRCGKASIEHGLMRIVDSGRVLHKLIFVQKTEEMTRDTRDEAVELLSGAEVADPAT